MYYMEGQKDATVPYPFKEQGSGLIAVIDALRRDQIVHQIVCFHGSTV